MCLCVCVCTTSFHFIFTLMLCVVFDHRVCVCQSNHSITNIAIRSDEWNDSALRIFAKLLQVCKYEYVFVLIVCDYKLILISVQTHTRLRRFVIGGVHITNSDPFSARALQEFFVCIRVRVSV